MACLNFAQNENSHMNQWDSILIRALLTILSTERVQNCINYFALYPVFPPRGQPFVLPNFYASRKMPLKSMLLYGVNPLAHNLIHTLCAELRWWWKSAVRRRFFA
ncbi:hypothetical protein [Janthinobacterium sp. LB3P118]|uniref:hypothetical protein n=1 Tax=Janthinobacterium sp. LB3P118 TaxID=3424195 RepID=UPI003F20AAF0